MRKKVSRFDVNFGPFSGFLEPAASRDKVRSSRQKITPRVKQRTTKNCDNVRLNHENCVFGWNLGFFHVHEQQRYAVLNVRVLSFREEQRAFFLLSFLSQIEL